MTGLPWIIRKKPAVSGGTDNTYVATAFYYYSALLTAKAAYVLGIRQDARGLQAACQGD